MLIYLKLNEEKRIVATSINFTKEFSIVERKENIDSLEYPFDNYLYIDGEFILSKLQSTIEEENKLTLFDSIEILKENQDELILMLAELIGN